MAARKMTPSEIMEHTKKFVPFVDLFEIRLESDDDELVLEIGGDATVKKLLQMWYDHRGDHRTLGCILWYQGMKLPEELILEDEFQHRSEMTTTFHVTRWQAATGSHS